MANILIFGAGSLGIAFSFPCSDKNHSVWMVTGDKKNFALLIVARMTSERNY